MLADEPREGEDGQRFDESESREAVVGRWGALRQIDSFATEPRGQGGGAMDPPQGSPREAATGRRWSCGGGTPACRTVTIGSVEEQFGRHTGHPAVSFWLQT